MPDQVRVTGGRIPMVFWWIENDAAWPTIASKSSVWFLVSTISVTTKSDESASATWNSPTSSASCVAIVTSRFFVAISEPSFGPFSAERHRAADQRAADADSS